MGGLGWGGGDGISEIVPSVDQREHDIGFQGALSRISSISLNSQNIYLCHRKPTNNGLFLLTIAILVC